jgi:hypothetical protein
MNHSTDLYVTLPATPRVRLRERIKAVPSADSPARVRRRIRLEDLVIAHPGNRLAQVDDRGFEFNWKSVGRWRSIAVCDCDLPDLLP